MLFGTKTFQSVSNTEAVLFGNFLGVPMSLSSEEVFEIFIALLILAVAVVMVKITITNIASQPTSLISFQLILRVDSQKPPNFKVVIEW